MASAIIHTTVSRTVMGRSPTARRTRPAKGRTLRFIELPWASLMFDVWLISRFGR